MKNNNFHRRWIPAKDNLHSDNGNLHGIVDPVCCYWESFTAQWASLDFAPL